MLAPRGGHSFRYVAFQAPHFPTQFYQRDAERNAHIPGQKRREFAAMITQIDDAVGRIVGALQAKGMWQTTLTIGFADNGGDVRTGASNYPHRGTKMTPWEGGTKAAAFVHSADPRVVPLAARGTDSFALAHVTDWFPSLLGLAGGSATPGEGKTLDGVDVWRALVSGGGVESPRTEMLYAMDPLGVDKVVARTFARARTRPDMDTLSGMDTGVHAALRVGPWKLIDGVPGRGDWLGVDPSGFFDTSHFDGIRSRVSCTTYATGADDAACDEGGRRSQAGYVMGPDVTNWVRHGFGVSVCQAFCPSEILSQRRGGFVFRTLGAIAAQRSICAVCHFTLHLHSLRRTRQSSRSSRRATAGSATSRPTAA